MFAICVKTGIIFMVTNTLFFHVWAPNIYGTSSTIYLIMFLKVISKVLFNITHTSRPVAAAASAAGAPEP